jgi:hypothetical protein
VPDFESKGASEVVFHQPRTANLAGTESPDACDLLIAELEARRLRLENLLHAVWLEVERNARRVPVQTRARCTRRASSAPRSLMTAVPARTIQAE